MMKVKRIFLALLVGLVLGIFPVAAALAANVDVVNNSSETISVSRVPAMGTTKQVVAPGQNLMFGANLGTKVTVARELNPTTTKPYGVLKEFYVTHPSKTYRVAVSGSANSEADVTLEVLSGSEY